MRIASGLGIIAVIATGCGGGEPEPGNKAAMAVDNGAAPAATVAAAPAAQTKAASAETKATPAAPGYTLAANGLGAGLTFGLTKARAVELATAAFGKPTSREQIDCPAGPMDFVGFGDLDLVFEDGRFTGWSIDGAVPALRTAGGIGIGSPRSALDAAAISEDDGIGQGFGLGEFGGYLDEAGSKVASLAAGSICQFG